MSDLDKIKKTLKQNKQDLRRDFKVKVLGIFGSYVRGEQKKNSDVDILVDFTQTPGLFDYMKGAFKPSIGKNIMREVVYV